MDTTPDLDQFTSRRSTMYATRGVVATSQPRAAAAGVATLRDGGNAFDAAVSTAAALNVVEPTSTGLGGDVFALYRTADGEIGALRSCGAHRRRRRSTTFAGGSPTTRTSIPTTRRCPSTAR